MKARVEDEESYGGYQCDPKPPPARRGVRIVRRCQPVFLPGTGRNICTYQFTIPRGSDGRTELSRSGTNWMPRERVRLHSPPRGGAREAGSQPGDVASDVAAYVSTWEIEYEDVGFATLHPGTRRCRSGLQVSFNRNLAEPVSRVRNCRGRSGVHIGLSED